MLLAENRRRAPQLGILAVAVSLLTGCAVGPKYHPPVVQAPPAYKEVGDWKPAQPNDQNLGGTWWTIFQDPQLDALELQVNVSNQNLKAAEAQFRQARAVLRYYRADYFPTLTAAPSATRTRVSSRRPPPGSTFDGVTSNDFVVPFDISYQADVWGRVRRNVESYREQAQASAADLAAVNLSLHADLAIECAPASVIEQICRPMLEAGKQVMVLSAGALLPRPELIELAKARGGQIIVPTGALLGLDAVTAAAEGRIHSVRMITRKPPTGLAGAPYLEANGISVEGLNAAKRVFSGTARDGAAGFPANVNVAAALSLAGIGPDRTMMEIWADPFIDRNCHTIEVDSDSARFTLAIENVPSENPKTGRITALSVLAALRKLNSPLRVGT